MSKSELSPIEKQVRAHLRRHFKKPDPFFILGVSGGPDSMALMYAFKRLQVRALIVHINYLTRGRESDQDAELVEQMAHMWGFDCHSFRMDHRKAGNENFQQWARDIRYRIFDDLRRENGADAVVTAHHQDDQLETILQKMLRGAGLASWAGMKIQEDHLFRPLLDTSSRAVKKYIDEHQVPYRIDKTNLEKDYARNFLRHEWLPDMEQHFPGWRANLLRVSEQAGVFRQALSTLINKEGRTRGGGLNRNFLIECEPELRKALVLEEIRSIDPDHTISRSALDQLNYLGELQTGRSIQLTDALELLRDRDRFLLQYIGDRKHETPHRMLFREHLEHEPQSLGDIQFRCDSFEEPDFEHALYLDADRLAWPLNVRLWQHGDRFRPLGMEGTQKVSDHLTNRKVPANRKKEALVIETFEESICAIIFPPFENRGAPGSISEEARCSDSTETCLKIYYR